MNNKNELLTLLSETLDKVPSGAECDILYVREREGLTRYTQSSIHQNMVVDDAHIAVRVIVDGDKVGVAITNEANSEGLELALKLAEEIARTQEPVENLPPLPSPSPVQEMDTFDQDTADFGPKERAATLLKMFRQADSKEVELSGAFAVSSGCVAVANTSGVRLFQPVTSARLNVLAFSETSSGIATGVSRKISEIDADKLTDAAIDKCLRGMRPQEIEPGEYDVLLEPKAVADLLLWVDYIGFGAKEFQEGTSFLSEKIGEKIVGDNITICDDPTDPRGFCFPFDMEGTPKQKVPFIENGVARGVVYDRHTATREGKSSTGHSFGPEYPNNPLATHIVMAPGESTREEMLGMMERGLLVSRFHYVNGFLDTRNAVLTGMTRDGTFLVEGGEIKHGVKNMRFCDSMVRALSEVAAISREVEAVYGSLSTLGPFVVPALLIRGFKFTSGTDH